MAWSGSGLREERASYHRRSLSSIELGLFNQLKLFYKKRNYDLSDVLKTIRNKRQHFSKFAGDATHLQHTYWSLLSVIFTTLFISRQDSQTLRLSFEELLSPNTMEPSEFEVFKLALEVISSVLKRSILMEDEMLEGRRTHTEPGHSMQSLQSLESEESEERSWGAAGETGHPSVSRRRKESSEDPS